MKFSARKLLTKFLRSTWSISLLIGLVSTLIAVVGRLLRPVPDQDILAFFISGVITFTLFSWIIIRLFRGSRKKETSPWYSTNQTVYHNNSACPFGNSIEPLNRHFGTGGKDLCQKCASLNRKKRK